MVDLVVLQSLSYTAGAISVILGVIYYVMNLRTNQRATRITITNNLLQTFVSEAHQKRWGELLNMRWSDYDDFEKKYGSDNNLDNFAKRQAVILQFDIIGNLLKSGLADKETLYNCIQITAPWTWAKFKSVLMENRRLYSGKDMFTGFEYLASEMMRMKLERDPSYTIPESLAEYNPDSARV